MTHVVVLTRWKLIDQPQSIALIALDHGREWMRADPSVRVTYAMPVGATQAEVDEWFRPVLAETSDRASFVEAYRRVTPRLAGAVTNGMLLDLVTDDSVDVVMSNQPQGTSMLRRMTDKPWVQWQMWTSTQAMVDMKSGLMGDIDLPLESISALFADLNCWESAFMLDSHRRTLEQWLNRKTVAEVMARSVVTPNGVNVPVRRHVSRETPRVLWGGNPKVATKRFDESSRVLEKIRAYTDAEIVLTSPSGWPDQKPGYDWRENVSRDEFVKIATESDVFVCNSVMETYGVAWLEMLGAGALGVFRESWWLKDLLPDWYPFVAQTVDEQSEMAIALVKQWPDGPLWECRDRVVEWVRSEHGLVTCAGKTLAAMKSVMEGGA